MEWNNFLDRQSVKALRDKIQEILNDPTSIKTEQLNGFNVSVGSASFNQDEVTFKLNLRVSGAKSQAEKDLEFWAKHDDLDLEKTAKIDGKIFKLSGYRRKARTKPYLMKDIASGSEYITTEDTAKRFFSNATK
tara:strand:- start:404 stop:805 length:402 start_codon:yes stop_codon:yes gene_type:complete